MNIEILLGVLLTAAICGLLAYLAALLLKTRQGLLGYVGAGLLGMGIGMWFAGVIDATSWPYTLIIGSASVHLLWTFAGALLVLFLFRWVPRSAR